MNQAVMKRALEALAEVCGATAPLRSVVCGEPTANRSDISLAERSSSAPRSAVQEPKAIVPPAGVVLVAQRYNGGSTPLEAVPNCWCCETPYLVQRLQECHEKTYAHLEPGCSCLDRRQAVNCCGLCLDHCKCRGGE